MGDMGDSILAQNHEIWTQISQAGRAGNYDVTVTNQHDKVAAYFDICRASVSQTTPITRAGSPGAPTS